MRKLQGDEIRKARRQKGWSQQKLAVNAGYTRQTIARYEKDKVKRPSIEFYLVISMMLDIDLNDNLEDTDGKHI